MTKPDDWEVEATIEADNGTESIIYVHKQQSGYRYQVTFDGGPPVTVGGQNGMAKAKALAYRIAERGTRDDSGLGGPNK